MMPVTVMRYALVAECVRVAVTGIMLARPVRAATQSIKTSSVNVPAVGQGADGGRKTAGRKRSIVTDTTGLPLTVLVTAASPQDSTAGEPCSTGSPPSTPPSARAGQTSAIASTSSTECLSPNPLGRGR